MPTIAPFAKDRGWTASRPTILFMTGILLSVTGLAQTAAASKPSRDAVGGVAGEAISNDPDVALQWSLINDGQIVEGEPGIIGADIDMATAWDIHSMADSVVVAIVDTGIDPHIEYAARLLPGLGSVGDPFDARDVGTVSFTKHGTHLAGIVGASVNNGIGIAGIASDVNILPVRVFESCCSVPPNIADHVAGGIELAIDAGADVVVVGVHLLSGSAALAASIDYANDQDVLVIAPTGNSGGSVLYPAFYEGCMAVSATTNTDVLLESSNIGPQVSLSAPGKGIWSTWANDGYVYQSGTAFAAAHVAGVAALVRAYNPGLTAAETRLALENSTDDLGPPGWDEQYGWGRLDAAGALVSAPAPSVRFAIGDSLPTTLNPGLETTIQIQVDPVAADVAGVTMFYSVDGGPVQSTPFLFGDGLYIGNLPAIDCGAQVEYYFLAIASDLSFVHDPLDAPDEQHSVFAGQEQTVFFDSFESDEGWTTVAIGDQTTGVWTRVAPNGNDAQPEYDTTPDDAHVCFVTGQYFGGSPGLTDVDYGPVILTSPVVNLPTSDAIVSYSRWFTWSGNGDEDFLTVEITSDGGDSWHLAEQVSSNGAAQWLTASFVVSDIIDTPIDTLQVRFSTSDLTNDSLTEAAIDDFRVDAVDCYLPMGDWNDDDATDLADFKQWELCHLGPDQPYSLPLCAVFDVGADSDVDLRDFAAFARNFLSQ